MADGTVSGDPAKSEEQESGGVPDVDAEGGLTDAQRELLERCLRALQQAENDSHTLAALLLITRVCPANQLDRATLKRIFEAVGLGLPARLLVTAVRGTDSSSLPPHQLLSLGTALLAALSTDPDMAAHPQLLASVPILLALLADGLASQRQQRRCEKPPSQSGSAHRRPAQAGGGEQSGEERADGGGGERADGGGGERADGRGGERADGGGGERADGGGELDWAMAADCYQVLTAVCVLPNGPEQLLSRGAVPALCRALEHGRPRGQDRALGLLGCLLSSRLKDKLWSKHPAELLSVFLRLSRDFCGASSEDRLDRCAQLALFLPPRGARAEDQELRGAVVCVWAALRPLLQSKLTARQLGPLLVLSACLLDLFGWELVGPPRFCCLLVNRACVEVRMGLEEPPGHRPSPEMRNTLTGCYRIMEAAVEQACCQGAPPPQGSAPSLTLQQSRQVLGVLEEAFSAQIYHLQQVDPSGYADPFVFATFRCLCSWLAEETSSLRDQVTPLLPFLIGYSRSHMQAGGSEQDVGWMSTVSVSGESGAWTGDDALRYLLPALCHLSAEEGPRKALLGLDAQGLLVDFLSRSWTSLRAGGRVSPGRDPSMETACSVLLNVVVTEPRRVPEEPAFGALEDLLAEALPVLVHKPGLLVLAANFCTLGLMMARLRAAPAPGRGQAGQRRFFCAALRLLHSALDPGSSPAPLEVESSWDEAGELWRLGLQALGGCVRAQPWMVPLVREEGWLQHVMDAAARRRLADPHTHGALEEALCALAEQCPACRREIGHTMSSRKGALGSMKNLQKLLELKSN